MQAILRIKLRRESMDTIDEIHLQLRGIGTSIQSLPQSLAITLQSSNHSRDASLFGNAATNRLLHLPLNPFALLQTCPYP